MTENEEDDEVQIEDEGSDENVSEARLDVAVCGPELWFSGPGFAWVKSHQTGPRS